MKKTFAAVVAIVMLGITMKGFIIVGSVFLALLKIPITQSLEDVLNIFSLILGIVAAIKVYQHYTPRKVIQPTTLASGPQEEVKS